jgi:hypothetical protein
MASFIIVNTLHKVTNNSNKEKSKVRPRTDHEGPEGKQKYSYTLSLTSALDRVGDQGLAPSTLHPGKTRYPLYYSIV